MEKWKKIKRQIKMKREEKNLNYVENKHISSGETSCLEEEYEKWVQLYREDTKDQIEDNLVAYQEELNERWSYEDILENPRKFFNTIAQIKIFPAYRYILNYIMIQTKIAIGEKNQVGLWRYVEEWKEKKNWEEQFLICKEEEQKFASLLKREEEEEVKNFDLEQYRLCIGSIFLRLKEVFVQNGRKKFEMEDFKNLLFHFTKKELKELAFGIKMEYQDYEIFRTKVLKLTRINFFDRGDIFVYLILKYVKQSAEEMSYYEAEKRLREIYPVSEEKRGQLEDRTTRGMRNELEEELEEGGKLKEEYKEQIFRNEIEIIKKELDWIDRAVSSQKQRSSKKKLEKYIESIRERLQQDELIKELYIGDRRERKMDRRQKRTREKINREDEVFAYFSYPAQKNFSIPAGTILYSNTNPKKERMEKEAKFITKEAVNLPKKEWLELEVPVRAISSDDCLEEFLKNSRVGKKLQRAVGKAKKDAKPVFLSQKYFEMAEEKKIVVLDEYLKNAVKEIQIGKGIRLFKPEKKVKNEGMFVLKCKWNEVILPHTVFEIWMEGYRFQYETVEYANTCKIRVKVKEIDTDAKKKPKKEEYLSMTEKIDGIYNVKLIRYIKKKEYLEFFCRRERKVLIQKDEIIELKNEYGHKFQYKILENVVSHDKIESPKITLKWENIEEIKTEYKNINSQFYEKEKWEILPTGTVFHLSFGESLSRDDKISERNNQVSLDTIYLENSNRKEKDIVLKEVEAFCSKPIYIWNRDYKDESEKQKEEKESIRDTEILRYFYQSSYRNINDYKGVMSYGKEYLLNTDLFKSTKLTLNSLHEFVGESEKSRNQILTLAFLEYILQDEEENSEIWEDEELDITEILEDFDYQVSDVLNELGYMSFYLGNAYDAFLYLLLCSDLPLDIFQNLWSNKHPMTQYIITYTPDWEEGTVDKWKLVEIEAGEEIELESWQTSTKQKQIFSMPKLDEKKKYILFYEREGKETRKIAVRQNESQEVSIILKGGKLQYCERNEKTFTARK
ncbi:MAG: hypothetical protein ACI4F9_04015 [Lachnospiraceae bacterium]